MGGNFGPKVATHGTSAKYPSTFSAVRMWLLWRESRAGSK